MGDVYKAVDSLTSSRERLQACEARNCDLEMRLAASEASAVLGAQAEAASLGSDQTMEVEPAKVLVSYRRLPSFGGLSAQECSFQDDSPKLSVCDSPLLGVCEDLGGS